MPAAVDLSSGCCSRVRRRGRACGRMYLRVHVGPHEDGVVVFGGVRDVVELEDVADFVCGDGLDVVGAGERRWSTTSLPC